MSIKERLENVRQLDVLIDEKQAEIDRIECVGVTDSNVKKMVRAYQGHMNEAVAKMLDEKEALMEIVDNAGLSVIELKVIYYRYFRAMKWADIAADLYYSEPGVYRIHKDALEKLDK